MKLACYDRNGRAIAALARTRAHELEVVDVELALQLAGVESDGKYTVPSLLADWFRLGPALSRIDLDALPFVRASEVKLLAPVGPGQLIVCCGFNYADHEAEVSRSSSVGVTWFIKNANSVIGTHEAIAIPADRSVRVDYEGELAIVFGRDCHRVSVAEAPGYLGGYTLINDVSARLPYDQPQDSPGAIRRTVIDAHLGKQYPTFCPVGPVVLTADEVRDPCDLTFTTVVNGTLKQRAQLSDMRLDVASLVTWLSTVFQFRVGDMISTGSPSGTGISQRPPQFLGQGDVVTIACPAIGELSNPVAVHTCVPVGHIGAVK